MTGWHVDYIHADECRESGHHGTDVDDDGYCNGCGHH